MSSVTIEVDLPEDWSHFSLPPALDARLTTLLDQQDRNGGLEIAEQREADALCKLVAQEIASEPAYFDTINSGSTLQSL